MLSVGLPVVAEAVGQVPEYVLQRETGLLRPSGDEGGIVEDLVFLLEDEEERLRLAENAFKHIKRNFSWKKLAKTAELAYVA